MRILGIALLLNCALAVAQDARPRLSGVSSARIANYNAPSVLIENREQVRAIVDEFNELRRKQWRRGEAKQSCYSTVVLTAGKKQVGLYRVTRDAVVEKPVEKGQSTLSLEIGEADLPRLRKMLGEIAPVKDCP